MDADKFLSTIADYMRPEAVQPTNKLATIDPTHVSGMPRVTFDGEETVSEKRYPFTSAYTPVANHRVLMVPVGQSYVIIARVLTA